MRSGIPLDGCCFPASFPAWEWVRRSSLGPWQRQQESFFPKCSPDTIRWSQRCALYPHPPLGTAQKLHLTLPLHLSLLYCKTPREPFAPSARPGPRQPHTDRQDEIPGPGLRRGEFQVGPKFRKGSTFSFCLQTIHLGVGDWGNPGQVCPHFLEVLRDNPTSKKHQLITPNTQGLPGAPTPGGHHIEAVLTRRRSLLGALQPHGLPHGSLLSPPGPRWDAWQCPPGGQPVQAHSPREGHHVIEWPGPKGKELGSSKAGATAEKPQEVRGPGARDGCSHMGPVLREAARCPVPAPV